MRKHKIDAAENAECSFNNWKFIAKIVLLLLITLFLLYDAFGLGISPSTRELYFEPGAEKTLSYHIINNEKKNISVSLAVSGDLQDYITLNDSMIEVLDSEEKRQLYYTLKFPSEMETGNWKAEIIATTSVLSDAGSQPKESSTITGTMSLASEISVIAASPDNYLLAKLDAHDVPENGILHFDITADNLGHNNLHNVFAAIRIYSPEDKMITEFDTGRKDIRKYSKSHIQASLPANMLEGITPGRYYANAVVHYDGLAAETGDWFNLGRPGIKIKDIFLAKVDDNTYKFDIDTISEWNSPIIGAYVILDVKDSAGSLAPQLRSHPFDIESIEGESIKLYAEFDEVDEERLRNSMIYANTIAEGNILESVYLVEDIFKSRIGKSFRDIIEIRVSVWFGILFLLIIILAAALHIRSLYRDYNKGEIKNKSADKRNV